MWQGQNFISMTVNESRTFSQIDSRKFFFRPFAFRPNCRELKWFLEPFNLTSELTKQDACCAFTPAILVWTTMQFSDTSPSHGKARQQRPLGLRHKIAQEYRFVSTKKSSPFYNSWPPAGVIMQKLALKMFHPRDGLLLKIPHAPAKSY